MSSLQRQEKDPQTQDFYVKHKRETWRLEM